MNTKTHLNNVRIYNATLHLLGYNSTRFVSSYILQCTYIEEFTHCKSIVHVHHVK